MFADTMEECTFAKTDCKVSQAFGLFVRCDTIDGIARAQHIGNRYTIDNAVDRLLLVLDVDDADIERLLLDVV